MPAVLSKCLARLSYESTYEDVGKRHERLLPVNVFHGRATQKRCPAGPGLSWSSYSEEKGILKPRLAEYLLECVNPLASEVSTVLASAGHDRSSMTYWILEEEVHAFKRVLNSATAELRDILDSRTMFPER